MLFEAILFITLLVSALIIVLDRKLEPYSIEHKSKIVTLAQAILPAVILVFAIRSFIFEGFRVSSVSMQPTLNSGDWIVVDKFSAGLRVPLLGYRFSKTNLQHGDVIVMRGDIAGQNTPLIKRIVGLPGDRIKIQDSRHRYMHTDLTVPENSYYVLGDNRIESHDSRMFGVVADRAIVGKARFIVFSFDLHDKQIIWKRLGVIK